MAFSATVSGSSLLGCPGESHYASVTDAASATATASRDSEPAPLPSEPTLDAAPSASDAQALVADAAGAADAATDGPPGDAAREAGHPRPHPPVLPGHHAPPHHTHPAPMPYGAPPAEGLFGIV
jgi:hypothetical protein